MSTDETTQDDGELPAGEIDQARTALRSVVHSFGAPTREAAQLCTDALNARYGASGGSAAFTGAEIDLMDLGTDDIQGQPFQVVFEHEAVVNNAYLKVVHEMEAIAKGTGVDYNGWQADEGDGII